MDPEMAASASIRVHRRSNIQSRIAYNGLTMGKWSGLVVLAIIVLQIVASIIQNRRKEQEKQRAREEAARRRALAEAQGQAGAAGPGGAVVGQQPSGQMSMAGGGPGAVVSAPRQAVDDLEARRRAQLEQLRQRRDGRRIGQPSAMSGGAVAAPPTSPRAGIPSPVARGSVQTHPSSSLGSSDQARIRQQEADQRARQQALEFREQQRRMGAERDAVERASQERERQRRETVARQAEQRRTAAAAATAGPVAAATLSQRLHQQTSLRDLMVLKEVLDAPLAMRDPGSGRA
jgi:hypothetical protein